MKTELLGMKGRSKLKKPEDRIMVYDLDTPKFHNSSMVDDDLLQALNAVDSDEDIFSFSDHESQFTHKSKEKNKDPYN